MAEPGYFHGKTDLDGRRVPWSSTFPIGTTFSCKKCGICCSMVGLTPKDVQTLKRAGLEDQVDYPRGNDLPRTPTLKSRRDGFCVNLSSDGLCNIYRHRPMICRAYPLQPTPGFENDLIVDISLRCPFIGGEEPMIKKKDIESAIRLFTGNVPRTISYSLKYRNTLAEHVGVAYAPAFILPRLRAIRFMDRAIDILNQVDEPQYVISVINSWADNVVNATQSIIIKRDKGFLKEGQDEDMLDCIEAPSESKQFGPSPQTWKTMFGDLNNNIFSIVDDRIGTARVDVGKVVKVNGTPYSWGFLENLRYSQDAVSSLVDYMKMTIRRANFGVCTAKIAQYIVDYKNSTAVEYDINCMLFSNALIVHVDPVARVIAAVNGHDGIEARDVRMALSNIDSSFMMALGNNTLARRMIKKLDGLNPVR